MSERNFYLGLVPSKQNENSVRLYITELNVKDISVPFVEVFYHFYDVVYKFLLL